MMKAVETYVEKSDDPDEQVALLLERWYAISAYILKNMPNVRRIIWSCQERRWVYSLFAELDEGSH